MDRRAGVVAGATRCAGASCGRTPVGYLVIEFCPDSLVCAVCDVHAPDAQALARRHGGVAYRLVALGARERVVDWPAVATSARWVPA